MRDVDYDRNRLELVFQMTEQALSTGEVLEMLNDRLCVLEKIHQDSPNIEATMEKLAKNVTAHIPASLAAE